MIVTLVYVLSYLNSATLLAPLGIGWRRRRQLTPALWLSWAALLAYFILFILSLLKALFWPDLQMVQFDYLIDGLFGTLFALAFYQLVPSGWRRRLIGGLAGVGLAGLLVEAVGQGRYAQASRWSVSLQTVLMTLITLLYLHLLLRQTRISLLRVPFFWITAGLLITLVLGTFYDAFQGLMLASSPQLMLGWLCFQLSVTILCNGLYAVGFSQVKTGSA